MQRSHLIAGLLALAGGGCAGYASAAIVVKRLAGAGSAAARDDGELRAATEGLRKKNEQLEALYTVFSEITESLEIRYVIATALREAIKLMRADMAVLRKVQGDELVSIGAMASTGQEIQYIRPVSLDQGPTGLAFTRGRSVRLDENGEQLMGSGSTDNAASPAAQTGRPPLESGLIVPLIIGARVVGTISCWSQHRYAFDADDEHILEMMASQVATAIVAADAMATSEKRALTDPLTELPNRLQLNDDLKGPLQALVEDGRQALVAMADIDHFKRFNDQYGHRVGDIALQKVAGVLRSSVRDGDHVYRYGGEEFVFVFRDAGPEQARVLAERVRSAVEATSMLDDDGEPLGQITISIGVAQLPAHGEDIRTLIELADLAMYRAKSSGRNRVVLWDDEMVGERAAA